MNSRQGFLGGSDMYNIITGNWRDLWLVKTGRKSPKDLSDVLPVQMGICTEALNIEWFEYQMGQIVTDQQKIFKVRNQGVPYKGTIDGYIRETNQLFEAKHTSANSNIHKLVTSYMPQMQLYCYLSGADSCYLSVFFGNNHWDTALIYKCEDYVNKLLNLCGSFWGHVVSDEEPIMYFGLDYEYPDLNSPNVIYRKETQ